MPDNLNILYNTLKRDNYDVPDDYNVFSKAMHDENNLKTLYSTLQRDNYDVPDDYNIFRKSMIPMNVIPPDPGTFRSFLNEGKGVADAVAKNPQTEDESLRKYLPESVRDITKMDVAEKVDPVDEFFKDAVMEEMTPTQSPTTIKMDSGISPDLYKPLVLESESTKPITQIEKPISPDVELSNERENLSYDVSNVNWLKDKPYSKYVGSYVGDSRRADYEQGRLESNVLSEPIKPTQIDIIQRSFNNELDKIDLDNSIMDSRGWGVKYNNSIKGYYDWISTKASSDSNDFANNTQNNLRQKYMELVQQGNMSLQDANIAYANEYKQQSDVFSKQLTDNYTSNNDALFRQYVSENYPEQDVKQILQYYENNKKKEQLYNDYQQFIKDYPDIGEEIEKQKIHEQQVEEDSVVKYFEEPVFTALNRVIDYTNSIRTFLPSMAGAALGGTGISDYSVFNEFVDVTSDLVDKNIKVRTSQKPIISGKEGEVANVNISRGIAETAGTLTDMALLMAGAETGVGIIKAAPKLAGALGKAGITAEQAGLFASSYVSIVDDFRKDGLNSGMSPAEAESYAAIQAGVQSMLELTSPNMGIRSTLFQKGARETMAAEAAKSLTAGNVWKSALNVLKEAGKETFLQELPQSAAQSLINGTINKNLNLDRKLNVDDVASIEETILLTMVSTSLMQGAAQGKMSTENKVYLGWAAQNYDAFKAKMDESLANGSLPKARYDTVMKSVEAMEQAINSLPENMTPEQKAATAPLIQEKNELQEKLNKTDERYKPQIQSQIDEVNKQLDSVDNSFKTTENAEVVREQTGEGRPQEGAIQREAGSLRVRDYEQTPQAEGNVPERISQPETEGQIIDVVKEHVRKNKQTGLVEEQVTEEVANQMLPEVMGYERPFIPDKNSTINQFRFRLMNPEQFDKGKDGKPFLRTEQIEEGVSQIWGNVNGQKTTQAIRFDKSKFTPEQMNQWLENNKDKWSFNTREYGKEGEKGQGLLTQPVEPVKQGTGQIQTEGVPEGVPSAQPKIYEESVKQIRAYNPERAEQFNTDWNETYDKLSKEKGKGATVSETARSMANEFLKRNKELIDWLNPRTYSRVERELVNIKNYDSLEKWMNSFKNTMTESQKGKINDLLNLEKYTKTEGGIGKQTKVTTEVFDRMTALNSLINADEQEYEKMSQEIDDDYIKQLAEQVRNGNELGYEPAEFAELYDEINQFIKEGRTERSEANKQKAEELNAEKQTVIDVTNYKKPEKTVKRHKEYLIGEHSRPTEELAKMDAEEILGTDQVHQTPDGKWRMGTPETFNSWVDETAKKDYNMSDAEETIKRLGTISERFNHWYDSKRNWFWSNLGGWNDLMSIVNRTGNRDMLNNLYYKYSDAVSNEKGLSEKYRGELKAIREKAFGKDYSKYDVKYSKPFFKFDKETVRPGIGKKEIGTTTHYLNMWELFDLYMQIREPDIYERLAKQGITEEIKKRIEDTINNEKPLLDYVNELNNWFNKKYNEINQVYRRMYGMNMEKGKFYYPVQSLAETKEPDILSPRLNAISAMNFSMIKKRTGGKRQILNIGRNANYVIEDYLNKSAHFIAFAEAARDLSRVFSDKSVKQAIAKTSGEGVNKVIDIFLDRARIGKLEKPKNEAFSKLFNYPLNFFTRATLGFKAIMFPKQLTGTIKYFGDMSEAGALKAMGKLIGNPKYAVGLMKELMDTPFIRQRWFDNGLNINVVRNKIDELQKKYPLLTLNKIYDYGFLPMKGGDIMAILVGGVHYYEYKIQEYKKQGMAETEAKKFALQDWQRLTKQLNATVDLDDVSHFNTTVLGRLLQVFMSDPGRIMNAVNRSSRNIVRSIRNGQSPDTKDVKKIILYRVFLPALFGFISRGGRTDESASEDLMFEIARGNMDAMPVVGDAIQGVIDTMRKRSPKGLWNIPAFQNLQAFTERDLVKVFRKGFDDFTMEDWVDLVGDLAKNIGVPYDPLKRYVVQSGNVYNGNDVDWLQFTGMSEYQTGKKKFKGQGMILNKLKRYLLGGMTEQDIKDMEEKPDDKEINIELTDEEKEKLSFTDEEREKLNVNNSE